MLLHLLSDYARDPSVRARFQEDPAKLMNEYGVSADAQARLQQRDPSAMADLLQAEAGKVITSEPIAMMPWPPPHTGIDVTTVSPNDGKAGTAVAVAVIGDGFKEGATVALNNPSYHVVGSNTDVKGDTHLATVFKVPDAPAGTTFDVIVTNPDGSTGTLTQGFTATE